MRREAEREEKLGDGVAVIHLLRRGARNFSLPLVFKVPIQCSLVPLVEVSSRSGEALGSEKVYGYEDHLHKLIKLPVRTSQETHADSITKPNRLMLFRETVAVYCENHKEHINTLCGQNAEFLYVTESGTYSYHCAVTC
jgi:hypothetical protein